MKIIVHDYGGYAFPVQLSRALAARGHNVLHLHCSSTETPHGELTRSADDPPGFDGRAIDLGATIPKTNFVRRLQMESKYARMAVAACRDFAPEAIISADTPSIIQHRLVRWSRRHGVRFVSWVQDLYGVAAYRILRRKLPGLGHAVGRYFIALDKSSARQSDAIVVITDDFRTELVSWGIDSGRIHVIHNWAPLEASPMRPRDNPWARQLGMGEGVRFIYSGTLAMKHNPALLLELGRTLAENSAGELLVVSQGAGVEWLVQQAAAEKLTTIRHLGFQPFAILPDVLGSADVLVAILEPDASVFSVPSKVLAYFCAGRPVLLAIPRNNLAAKTAVECGAGLVVDPTDVAGFCSAARQLIDSPQLRRQCGEASRRYAEAHFDIRRIGDQFERLLTGTESNAALSG
jgi:glycosyltransferase involved in cell wall biosynthesis